VCLAQSPPIESEVLHCARSEVLCGVVGVAARFSFTDTYTHTHTPTGQNGPAVRSSSTTYSPYSSSSRHCDVTVRPQLPDELPDAAALLHQIVSDECAVLCMWRDQTRKSEFNTSFPGDYNSIKNKIKHKKPNSLPFGSCARFHCRRSRPV
jgi:hypothetical protein